MTLVVLAAGMGSRYGGLKQMDPITEHGEFIIDFSVYDAIRAVTIRLFLSLSLKFMTLSVKRSVLVLKSRFV